MNLYQKVVPIFKFAMGTLATILSRTSTADKKKKLINIWGLRIFLTSSGRSYLNKRWYLSQYSDLIPNRVDPVIHFIFYGSFKGFNPNPYFDSIWYSNKFSEVATSEYLPFLHYLKVGYQERHNPHPLFDAQWYFNNYRDVAQIDMEPLLHYLKYGIPENRNPNPYFDTAWYIKKYKEVKLSDLTPLEHHINIGQEKGYSPHPYFDIQWYLSENPEIKECCESALIHYIEKGVVEDKDPNPYFNSRWYKNRYPDVITSGLPPLRHYLEIGAGENRQPSDYFHTSWYLEQYPDVPYHGMEALYHYLQHGQDEGRQPFYEPIIPGYSKARNGLPSKYPMQLHQPLLQAKTLQFDLVLVTYNSSRWVDKCLTSLLIHDSHITITIVDNGSTDNTITKLEAFRNRFSSFKIQNNPSNLGFGAANNIGAQLSEGKYLLFLNIDTESHDPEMFTKLSKIVSSSHSDVVAWELRQLPYEHPKCYDPVSLETNWVSGAAFVIRRDAFMSSGGFDEKLFMYCEDVDLSWRLRSQGYRLLYIPSITITHHSYSTPGEVKPIAQIYGVKHNYFLRNRFGTQHERRAGKSLLLKFMQYAKNNLAPEMYEKLLDTEQQSHFFRQSKYEASGDFAPVFDHFEYDVAREGGFYVSEIAQANSMVSVIIRTIGNLHYLEKAIYSVLNQTYKNTELVIIEDGSNHAKSLVEKFKGFNIIYKAVEKMGRCNAGNVGLETATGDFFNFLDEDDLFYCDHVETLINAIHSRPEIGAVWSSAFSVKTEINKESKVYSDKEYTLAHQEEPCTKTILQTNFFPIQAVLFRRECYETLGGFDPLIDLLEDWDLWIRYLKNYKFYRVKKTTSLYRVPFKDENYKKREKDMQKYYQSVRKKHI